MKNPIIKRLTNIGRNLWQEWRGSLFFIAFVFIPVKSSLADWNWVPTGSMIPTIMVGDLVFVNKAAYDLRFPLTLHRLAKWSDPQRGDIVVLFSPEDGIRLVKRVIGVPGDTVELRDNALYLNGKAIPYSLSDEELAASDKRGLIFQEYLPGHAHSILIHPGFFAPIRDFARVVVPEGKYFVMGDNRDFSKDSRMFGFADRASIVGKATRVVASFDGKNLQPRWSRTLASLD